MNIAVVGLGLIGGSFCKAIKKYTENTVYGFDKNKAVCDEALFDGAVDYVLFKDDLCKIDVLFIALYPKATIEYIENNYTYFNKNILVCDLCGVKEFVCNYAFKKARKCGFEFIGCHPMAGKEFSGYTHSCEDLFCKASMIVTPPEDVNADKLNCLKDLIMSVKFGSIKMSTPKEHDAIIACTSQLAHVVSSAYVKNKTASNFKGFCAGSFADMTRVAKLNPDMWTELFFENRENLICEIQDLICNLAEFKDCLDSNDSEKCKELLIRGTELKEKFLNEEAEN